MQSLSIWCEPSSHFFQCGKRSSGSTLSQSILWPQFLKDLLPLQHKRSNNSQWLIDRANCWKNTTTGKRCFRHDDEKLKCVIFYAPFCTKSSFCMAQNVRVEKSYDVFSWSLACYFSAIEYRASGEFLEDLCSLSPPSAHVALLHQRLT